MVPVKIQFSLLDDETNTSLSLLAFINAHIEIESQLFISQ